MKFFSKGGVGGNGKTDAPTPYTYEIENDGGSTHTKQVSPRSSAKSASAAVSGSRFNFYGPSGKTPPPPPPPAPVSVPVRGIWTSNAESEATPTSSRFGFANPFGKSSLSQSQSQPQRSIAPIPLPPSSKKKGKESKSKKAAPHKSFDGQDLTERQRHKSSSKQPSSCRSRLCCCFFKCGLVLIIGAIVGVVLWRYGPWTKDKASVTIFSFDTAAASTTAACPDCCNGSAAYCDLTLDEVVFPMVRRAHSSTANNFVNASNSRPFEEALVKGYRALQLSTCMCDNYFLSDKLLERDETWGLAESNLGFCNNYCVSGVRDPKVVLSSLMAFIHANPREVLIVVIEMGEDSSTDLRNALLYSGLLEYIYIPQSKDVIKWPTLGDMISMDKRLVLFGAGDGMESCPANDCPDGILAAADHVALSTIGDLTSCAPTNAGDDVPFSLFQMNQYEDDQEPSLERAQELNSFKTLKARMESCEGYRGPNLLAVEFWDEGDVLNFVETMNSGESTDLISVGQRGLR